MTPTRQTWKAMIRRCRGPSDNFKYYGGRGIKVDHKWLAYEGFVEDMGQRPEGCTLDRMDKDGDYTKANCRWATTLEQGRNRSNNTAIELNGVSRCISEWCEVLGLERGTIRKRILKGWPIEEVLRPKAQKHHVTGRSKTTTKGAEA